MQSQGRKQPAPPVSQQTVESNEVSVIANASDFNSEAFIQQLPSELREKVSLFDKQLNNLENFLKPLYQFNNLKQLCQELDPLEKAKFVFLVANFFVIVANAIFFVVYLKTQGVNPQKHPVKKEIERIQVYMKKIKQKQEELLGKSKSESKPSLSLDKEAAKRIITNALNKKNEEDEEMTDKNGKENLEPQKDTEDEESKKKPSSTNGASADSSKKRKMEVAQKPQPQQKKRK